MRSELDKLIDDADEIIDGECNCETPEYRALDLLRFCVKEINRRIVALDNSADRMAQQIDTPNWRDRR